MAKDGATRGSGRFNRFLIVLLVLVGLPIAGGLFLIHSITHPPRDRTDFNPEDLLLRTEEAAFQARDGVMLSGWLVKGAPGSPVIILCHDLGGSRFSLLNSAVSLNRAGYPLFVFDFRGHGRSGGRGASLGTDEKNDILGAIEFLQARKDVDATRLGVWGIGMGAYAAALAAAETPGMTALALDAVYPDVPAQLDRLVRERFPPALHAVVPALRVLYNPYFAFRLKKGNTVAGNLERLADRNILIIAAADAPERHSEEQALYAALPDSAAGDKNFLELRASGISGLYAEDKRKYDESIVRFFQTYLPRSGRPAPGKQAPLQVLER
jgi:pimeloyl-ACP methyl ester carboxylesterase